MEGTPNGLRARVDYLQERQTEDRRALERVSEATAATAQTLAVVHEQISALQRRHDKERERADAEHKELWEASDRAREMAIRAILVVLAAAVSYAFAAGVPHL
jgi:uncharacterized coiled-coil DUF342 family protein